MLLLDDHDRVLLIHERVEGEDLDHWLTPGGGVEERELLPQAAMRETYEETGLRVELPDDAPVVHEQRRSWSWRGVGYDQTDHYFVSEVTGAPTISHPGLTGMEQLTLIGVRWWTVAELRASADTFIPPEIADIVERVTARRRRSA